MLEIGGITDHIHILMRQRQDVSVADMVRIIKSNSSKCRGVNPGIMHTPRYHWDFGTTDSTTGLFLMNRLEDAFHGKTYNHNIKD